MIRKRLGVIRQTQGIIIPMPMIGLDDLAAEMT